MKLHFERLFGRGNAPSWLNRWVLLAVLALTATVATGSGLLWGLPTAQSQTTPTVTLTAPASSYEEGHGAVTLTVSLDVAPPAGTAAVEVTLTGGGLPTADYALSSPTLTFESGTTMLSRTVTLTVNNRDDIEEGSRSLTITPSVTAGNANPGSGLTLTITDDDAPTVTVSGSTASLEEGTTRTLTFTADKTPINPLMVTISGTNSDLSASVSSVTLQAGQLSQSVTFTAVADTMNENNENVLVTFSLNTGADSGAALAGNSGSRTFTITDAPHVTVAVVGGGATFSENDGANNREIMLTVSADVAPSGSLFASLSVSGDLAADEYTLTPSTVNLTSILTANVMLTLINDDIEEGSRSFVITPIVTNPVNGGSGAALTLTITDDDDAPVIMVSVDDSRLAEGEQTTLRLTASKTPIEDLTVSIAGDNVADWSVSDTSVTFADDAMGADLTQTVTFTADTDSMVESNEDVELTFSLPSGGNSQATFTAGSATLTTSRTITITDAPRVTVTSPSGTRFNEDASGIPLVVEASASPVGGDLVVTLTAGGLSVGNFELNGNAVGSVAVTFTQGATGADLRETVTLNLLGDEREEDLIRTLTITPSVADPTRGSAGSPLALTVDDDDTPMISVMSDQSSVNEGDAITVRLSVNKRPRSAVTVAVGLNPSGDASLPLGASVMFPSGTAVGTERTLTFMALNDDLDELDETVTLTYVLTRGNSRAMIAAGTNVVITVVDTDVPELSFSTTALSLTEGGSGATFTVNSNIAVAADVGVTVGLSSGDGTQFILSDQFITIPAGETVSQPVTLTAIDDNVPEVTKTAALDLTVTPGTGTVGSDLVVTVIDNDTPNVTLTAMGGTTFTENDGANNREIMLLVTLSAAPAGGDVTVNLMPDSSDGLVRGAGGDYTLSPSSVMFTAGTGTLTETVTLTLNNDDVEEALSRDLEIAFTTTASGQASANAVGSPLVLTVTDDDTPMITVVSNDNSLNEGEMATLTFTVNKSPRSAVTVTVNVPNQFSNDVSLSGGSVTFPAGATGGGRTQTLTLTASNDVLDELDEAVGLTFGVSSGTPNSRAAVAAASTSVSITVVDTDVPQLSFSPSSLNLDEGGPNVTFTVNSSIAVAADVVVAVAVASGDASQFNINPTSVTIPAGGMTSGMVTLSAINDSAAEVVATVNLEVSVTGGEATVPANNLAVTVNDDDTPNVTLTAAGGTTINENVGSIMLFVTLSGAPAGGDVRVDLTPTSPDGLVRGVSNDYTLSPSQVTFMDGTGALTETITLTLINDELEEELSRDLEIAFTTTPTGQATANVMGSPLVLTITDDDTPVIEVVSYDTSLAEGEQTILRLKASKTPIQDLRVNIMGSNDADSSVNVPFVNFADDAMGSALTRLVTFTASSDSINENDEDVALTFELMGGTTSRATFATGSATLATGQTITITDAPHVTVTFASGGPNFDEAEGAITLNVVADASPVGGVLIVDLIPIGFPALVGGSLDDRDYTLEPRRLRFDEGATGADLTQTATLTLHGDDLEEELVRTLRIRSSLLPSTRGSVGSVLDVIVEDDDTPDITVAAARTTLAEGEATVLTFTASKRVSSTVSLTVSHNGGGDATFPTSVTLQRGQNTATATFRAVADSADEGNEVVTLSFSLDSTVGDSRATLGTTSEAITITDAPNVTVTVADGSSMTFNEANGERVIPLDVVADASPVGGALVVTLTPSGSDLVNGVDYTLSRTTVTFAAGASGGDLTQQVMLTLHADDIEEEMVRTLTVTPSVNVATRGTVSPAATLVWTLNDDDTPIISVVVRGSRLDEGGETTVTFTVSKSPRSAVMVGATVPSQFRSDASLSAVSVSSAETVTFQQGAAAGSTQTLTFRALDDRLDEMDELVALAFGLTAANSRAMVAAGASVRITVVDTDVPQLSFSSPNLRLTDDGSPTVDLNEGGSPVTFTVISDIAVVEDVMLQPAAVSGAVSEFSITPFQGVTIPAGTRTSETVTLTAVNDGDAEVTKMATVRPDVVGGDARAIRPRDLVVRVLDDDAPNVTIEVVDGGSSFTEGSDDDEDNRVIMLDVSLSNAPAGGDVTVNLRPSGLGAGEYRLSRSSLIFAAGATVLSQRVALTLINDNREEETETLSIALATTTTGEAAANVLDLPLELTIEYSDEPEVEVTIDPPLEQLSEGQQARVTFRLTKIPISPVKVTITGVNDNDDVSVSATEVILDEDQLSQRITFRAVNDLDDEREDEEVALMFVLDAGGSRAARVVNARGTLITGSAPLVFNIVNVPPPVGGGRIRLPGTGDGGVLGLWGVAGLALSGTALIGTGVVVVRRRRRGFNS